MLFSPYQSVISSLVICFVPCVALIIINGKKHEKILFWLKGLCIKVGQGQGDGDIGTRVWGLGTWGCETRDLKTSSMGRRDVWDEDAEMSKTGMQGTWDVNDYCKSWR